MSGPVVCDICGYKNPGNLNYCGGCGVDLRESKDGDVPPNPLRKRRVFGKTPTSRQEGKDIEEKLRVVKWCWLRTYELPYVLVLMSRLAQGKSELGFCDCGICTQGYREILAIKENISGRDVDSHSREIVLKARETKISDISLDISDLLLTYPSSEKKERPGKEVSPTPTKSQASEGKILIEIDEGIIENAVVKVLQSEKGRQIIQESTSSRKRKTSGK